MKFSYRNDNGDLCTEEIEISDTEGIPPNRIPIKFYQRVIRNEQVEGDLPSMRSLFPYSQRNNHFFENEEVANAMQFYEDPYNGNFIRWESLQKKRDADEDPMAGIRETDLTQTPKQAKRDKKRGYIKGTQSPSFISTGHLDYAFGVEFETCSGYVPPYVYYNNNLNLKCEKDGSLREEDGTLRGGEYVTGILKGDTGVHHLYKICKELSKRCKVDKKCGLHVHIGYTYFTKDFSVFAHILGEKIQEDFFSIMPVSRRDNPYCNFLPEKNYEDLIKRHGMSYGVEMAYSDLMQDMANGKELGPQVNKFHPHPEGRFAGSNGQGEVEVLRRLYRYKWLNLIPSNFNQGNKPIKNTGKLDKNVPFSIEFRNHSGTLNFNKVKNYLLICMAFVNYIENNKQAIIECDKISLEDIVEATFSGTKVYNKVMSHIDKRRKKFQNLSSPQQDLEEIIEEQTTGNYSISEVVKNS